MKGIKKDMYDFLDSCEDSQEIYMLQLTKYLNRKSGRQTYAATYLRYLRLYRTEHSNISIINTDKARSKYVYFIKQMAGG